MHKLKWLLHQWTRTLFCFMDLKSSTMHAEKLGHLKYSAMIRDCFFDINQILTHYNAEVYQYVGDEIVLSWVIEDSLDNSRCFEFFFAVFVAIIKIGLMNNILNDRAKVKGGSYR